MNSEVNENEIIHYNGKKYIRSPFLIFFSDIAKNACEFFVVSIVCLCILAILFIYIGGAIISIYLVCIKQWHAFRDDDNDDKYTSFNNISLISIYLWISFFVAMTLVLIRYIYKSKPCQNFIIKTFYTEVEETPVITTTTPITLIMTNTQSNV